MLKLTKVSLEPNHLKGLQQKKNFAVVLVAVMMIDTGTIFGLDILFLVVVVL